MTKAMFALFFCSVFFWQGIGEGGGGLVVREMG